MFADLEALLIDWLAERTGGVRVVSEVPAELATFLTGAGAGAIVALECGPGSDDGKAFDTAQVDVDWLQAPDQDGNPDRAAARDGAELVRSLFVTELIGYWDVERKAVVTDVQTRMRPHKLPWDDSNLRRMGATYLVTAKSNPAT